MNNSELRKTLEEHLDLLKRNLAVASLEVLKTKYKNLLTNCGTISSPQPQPM